MKYLLVYAVVLVIVISFDTIQMGLNWGLPFSATKTKEKLTSETSNLADKLDDSLTELNLASAQLNKMLEDIGNRLTQLYHNLNADQLDVFKTPMDAVEDDIHTNWAAKADEDKGRILELISDLRKTSANQEIKSMHGDSASAGTLHPVDSSEIAKALENVLNFQFCVAETETEITVYDRYPENS